MTWLRWVGGCLALGVWLTSIGCNDGLISDLPSKPTGTTEARTPDLEPTPSSKGDAREDAEEASAFRSDVAVVDAKEEVSASPPPEPQPGESRLHVPVVGLRPGTIRRVVTRRGEIQASQLTSLHARIAGLVRVASHEAGELVRAGTVLAELEAPELDADLQYRRAEVERARARTRQAEAALAVAEAAIHRAQADLAQVRASIRRADAEVERGRTQFQRIDQLAKESVLTAGLRDESLNRYMLAQAARREIDARLSSAEAALAQARAERDKAQADLAAAQADITVAEAEIARAQVLERHRRIVAPHDGILLERRVEPGQTTLPGDTGEPLFILARNDRVRAVVVVPEDVAALMNVGQEAEIRPPTVEERCVAGKVSRLSGPLDPINPTWRVEIDLANPDHLLQPGQVVSVTVILDERTDVPTLPRVAVAGRGESAFCFVAEDGLARLRRIRTGLANDERVEVLAGLDVSDRIIVVDPATLSDGQPIHAVNLP